MNYTEQTTATRERVGTNGRESLSDLLKDFRDEVVVLARQEVELAKTETSESISRITRNAIALLIGAVISLIGGVVFVWGLGVLIAGGLNAAGLSPWISSWLGALIAGGVVLIIGYILLQTAINKIKRTNLVPEKTVNSLKEDQKWIRQR